MPLVKLIYYATTLMALTRRHSLPKTTPYEAFRFAYALYYVFDIIIFVIISVDLITIIVFFISVIVVPVLLWLC
jgi:hypothetical protein